MPRAGRSEVARIGCSGGSAPDAVITSRMRGNVQVTSRFRTDRRDNGAKTDPGGALENAFTVQPSGFGTG